MDPMILTAAESVYGHTFEQLDNSDAVYWCHEDRTKCPLSGSCPVGQGFALSRPVAHLHAGKTLADVN